MFYAGTFKHIVNDKNRFIEYRKSIDCIYSVRNKYRYRIGLYSRSMSISTIRSPLSLPPRGPSPPLMRLAQQTSLRAWSKQMAEPDVLRPDFVGMHARVYGHTTTAMYEYRVHPHPPQHISLGPPPFQNITLLCANRPLQDTPPPPRRARAKREKKMDSKGHIFVPLWPLPAI